MIYRIVIVLLYVFIYRNSTISSCKHLPQCYYCYLLQFFLSLTWSWITFTWGLVVATPRFQFIAVMDDGCVSSPHCMIFEHWCSTGVLESSSWLLFFYMDSQHKMWQVQKSSETVWLRTLEIFWQDNTLNEMQRWDECAKQQKDTHTGA